MFTHSVCSSQFLKVTTADHSLTYFCDLVFWVANDLLQIISKYFTVLKLNLNNIRNITSIYHLEDQSVWKITEIQKRWRECHITSWMCWCLEVNIQYPMLRVLHVWISLSGWGQSRYRTRQEGVEPKTGNRKIERDITGCKTHVIEVIVRNWEICLIRNFSLCLFSFVFKSETKEGKTWFFFYPLTFPLNMVELLTRFSKVTHLVCLPS